MTGPATTGGIPYALKVGVKRPMDPGKATPAKQTPVHKAAVKGAAKVQRNVKTPGK